MDQDGRVVEAGQGGLVDAEDVGIEIERDALPQHVAGAGALDDDARAAVGERRHSADGRRDHLTQLRFGAIAILARADDPELLRSRCGRRGRRRWRRSRSASSATARPRPPAAPARPPRSCRGSRRPAAADQPRNSPRRQRRLPSAPSRPPFASALARADFGSSMEALVLGIDEMRRDDARAHLLVLQRIGADDLLARMLRGRPGRGRGRCICSARSTR